MAKHIQATGPVGVLLANTGTPDEPTPRAIKKYLSKFLMDKRIAPMNRYAWWCILHFCILPKRGKASAAKYQRIWTEEGSPFLINHKRLTKGLQDYYHRTDQNVVVACGFSYSEPSIGKALKQLASEGCSRIVVLPLYPQSAYCTTGSVKDSVERALKKVRFNGQLDIIDNYFENPTFVKAIAASIVNAGFEVDGNDRLLFSYHSIPLNDIDAGDTYELQTGTSSLLIAGELGLDRKRWTIGYQCRFDKGRDWLQPFTPEILRRWARAGEGRVFVVCPNFSVDCLETLYDVVHEQKAIFLQASRDGGGRYKASDFVYVPCLNRSKAHLRVLTEVLDDYVG